MPLTPNGKIDKNRLPYPDTAVILMNRPRHKPSQHDAEHPITPLQKELMGVWEEVLGRPVHPRDNFFEVGGHSILATRLTFQMRQVLRQDLPLNLLYKCPTVSQLAQAIEALGGNAVTAKNEAYWEKQLGLKPNIGAWKH